MLVRDLRFKIEEQDFKYRGCQQIHAVTSEVFPILVGLPLCISNTCPCKHALESFAYISLARCDEGRICPLTHRSSVSIGPI